MIWLVAVLAALPVPDPVPPFPEPAERDRGIASQRFLGPCDGPAAEPWVTELRDRLLASDALAHYAVEQFGEPRTCDGAVTSDSDLGVFGRLVLGFANGETLEVETMPPETQILRLRAPDGIHAEASAKAVMRSYAFGIGLQIDWSAPRVQTTGTTREETFWDPGDGLNASVTFSYRGDVLVGMRLSLAL